MAVGRFASVQVACVYVGTVVGAGFASGQELHQFFGRNGALMYPSAVLATLLFAWLGYRVMMLGQRLQATSYMDVSRHLFGPRMALVVNVSLNVMLFGVTVAMLAGSGALFHERLSVPFTFGALLTAGLTFVTLLFGLKGVLRANLLIVPMMFGFLCILAVRMIALHPAGSPAVLWTLGTQHLGVWSVIRAAVSAGVYVAFNVGLAAGVLIPVGGAIRERETLWLGAVLGATTLGVMIVAGLSALERLPTALTNDIPMAVIAGQFGTWFAHGFAIVLFGEIFSTLVGNLFALIAQIPQSVSAHRWGLTAIVLVVAIVFSHIGFSAIVAYGYSLFGWMSTGFLFVLLWPRTRQNE